MDPLRTIKIGRHDLENEPVELEELDHESLLEIENEFLRLRKTPEPVYFDFGYSRGGDHLDSIRLADLIMENKVPTIAVCRGVVVSAGVLIFLAAQRRYAFDNIKGTRFWIHEMWVMIYGSRVDSRGRLDRQTTRRVNVAKDGMRRIIRSRTKFSKEEVEIMLTQRKDTYIDVYRALEVNIIQGIINDDSDV